MIPLNQALTPNPNGVAAEVIDGEAIIINLATGVYYSMDGVGGSIWQLIEGRCRLDQIVGAIEARYDAPREQVEADVRRVAEELFREELAAVSGSEPGSPAGQEFPLGEKGEYETPELKTYRDMGDLLALDPHLPGMREIPWKAPGDKPLD